MAKQQKKEKITEDKIIALYMDYVLETEHTPRSVYKFSKDHKFSEEVFYSFFGSFEALRKRIWEKFFENSMEVMKKSKEYTGFNEREKLLSFYFTFFEVLTANRSYVLYTLSGQKGILKHFDELKSLRRRVKSYAKELVTEANAQKTSKLFRTNEMIFSEGVWVQFLFLLNFWLDDNSPGFESTDAAIEKSVNTVFDLLDNKPLERLVDFGKFIWNEKRG